MRVLLIIVLSFFFLHTSAQKKPAVITGRVIDENEDPISNVSVTILGRVKGVSTNDSGSFTIKVPPKQRMALIFTHVGYNDFEKGFYLSDSETENLTVRLKKGSKTLETVVVTNTNKAKQPFPGIQINPRIPLQSPTVHNSIEDIIKNLTQSTNEVSSQYNVRGGNYDENLVYINDFEVFRPYLVNSGQQEGLSLINPELAGNISFFTGGFQSKYGDKMSSVLDIQYKQPVRFGGSAYISLLEQGLHVEGVSKNYKLTYQFGFRNKSNRNLLSSQETTGDYVPSSDDIQGYLTYQANDKWRLELLGITSATRFSLIPESAEKTSSVFSPFYTSSLGLNIFFEGQEKDAYNTNMAGFSAINAVNKNLTLKWMLSYFKDQESENTDIGASYLFGERDFDNTSSTFGQITNPLGAGFYQNYSRNKLNIDVWNLSHKGMLDAGRHFIQWGATVEQTKINDKLYEWEYQDSAGYSLPLGSSRLNSFLNSTADLSIQKYSGYLQDDIFLGDTSKRNISFQAGLRYNYNSLNKEFFISPRIQLSIKPRWNKNMTFRFAAGSYNQPPFYRELRKYDGTLNTDVKSQKSFQLVAGMDYKFKSSNRPLRLTTEAYYKNMWDVNPYDIDNVRIRYFGNNNAKAYAYGVESRLYGELTKGAESWLSVSLMKSMENIDGDFYYIYKNKYGNPITDTGNQVVTQAVKTDVGWIRRPTDRFLSIGVFLQDYLSTNENFKVHLSIIYGTNMPYNIPNSTRYRNALVIDPYIRTDIGFSVLLLSEKSRNRSHSPFKDFQSIWGSLEVFNLIDRANVISYQLIKDFSNTVYTIPNRLTPRLINFKIVGRF